MRDNWEIGNIGEACEILDNRRKPITKKDRVEGDYPYYGATGILSYVEGYIFDEKLVLLGEDGAKWESGDNSAFIINGKTWVNNHAHVLRPNRKVLLDEWLVYNLNFQNLITYVSGMTVPKLNQGNMKKIQIPIPPIEEQKEIVEILDQAFESIEKAKANIERNIENAKELFQSKANQIFFQKGEGWEIKKLNDICEVKDGTHDSPKYVDEKDGVPFITQKNILDDGLSFEKVKFISQEDHNHFYKRSNVAYNDILFSMIGANRGMACIVDNKRIFSIKNVGLIKSNNQFLSKFILYFLKSPIAKKYVSENSSGSAQGFIALGKLRSFTVPFINITKQKEIVETLDIVDNHVQSILSSYEEELKNLEELKKSILQKAFSGELTNKNKAA